MELDVVSSKSRLSKTMILSFWLSKLPLGSLYTLYIILQGVWKAYSLNQVSTYTIHICPTFWSHLQRISDHQQWGTVIRKVVVFDIYNEMFDLSENEF